MSKTKKVDVPYPPLTDEEREWLDAPPVGMEWGSEEWDKEFNGWSTAKSPDDDTKSHDDD